MAKKVILLVLGGVLMLCGLGAVVPGAVLTRLTGGDGTIDTGYHAIGSATPALVSPTEKINESDLPTSGPGAATITVTARNADQPVFLGVGPAAAVDDFLAGVAYDEVREFQARPYQVRTSRHSGGAFADPPGEESFWLASATGTNPTLDWKVRNGDYRLVLMNADGSPGAAADAQIGVQVSGLHGLGIGVMIAGAVATLAGLGLVLWGIATPSHRPQPAAAPGSYPLPPGGPPTG
jgi:hypothetical protein